MIYYLGAIILIYSDNINYCIVVNIGRFLQFSMDQSQAINHFDILQ